MLLWKDSYPGIYIDGATDGDSNRPLGVGEGHAFASATRAALNKIESRPVGKDLLSLISKRCKGIGTKLANGRVRIRYGTGTLEPGRVSPLGALEATAATDVGSGGDRTSTPIQVKMAGGSSAVIPGMGRVGSGASADVCYNPFISIGSVSVPGMGTVRSIVGVETPAFVALAHELCHALHVLSGDAKAYPFPEEAWTVGAGKFSNTRISENAVRKEHGIPLRRFYFEPGDCD